MNSAVPSKRLVVYRRLIELFLPCIILSVIITLLNASGLVLKRVNVVIMVSVCVCIFTVYNFFNLRNCYHDLCNKKLYYELNLLSYAIFAVANMLLYAFASNEVYTWLFSITKALTFIDINTIYSILCFHFIELICIFASTIGMEWIFYERENWC